tara:strand:+ start:90 stop:428 length:339 start_codon:yes stop_codon:yes gene_type:complete
MTNKNEKVAIQFLKGQDEKGFPEIRLFRNDNGKKGTATYKFKNPSTITVENLNLITKMYLIDKEGEISTKRIELSISDNYVKEVKSTYSWNSEIEFERFMRFSERYARSHTI